MLLRAQVIESERSAANEELQAALPFLRDAEEAAKSINKRDLGIIQRLAQPPDLIRRIMDCVLILNLRPLVKPVAMMQIKTGKNQYQGFVRDSYNAVAKRVMGAVQPCPLNLSAHQTRSCVDAQPGFVKMLLDFSESKKDRCVA